MENFFYTCVSILVGAATYRFISRRKKKVDRKRRMSFHSEIIACGAYPDKCQMPEPIINVVVLFDKCPTKENIARSIHIPMVEYERFRSRVIDRGSNGWEFEELKDYPPENLVHESSFSGSLQERINEEMVKPLRNGKDAPQHEYIILRNDNPQSNIDEEKTDINAPNSPGNFEHVVGAMQDLDEKFKRQHCVLLRIHHSIGDGISLVPLITKVFTGLDDDPIPPLARFGRKESKFNPSRNTWMKIFECLYSVLALPHSAYDSDIGITHKDRKNIVFQPSNMQFIPLPTLDFGFIRQLREKVNKDNSSSFTVNDIIFTATAGAIQRYADFKGKFNDNEKKQIRALVPVALPRKKNGKPMTNRWSFASCPLPIGRDLSIMDRMRDISNFMTQLKSSPLVYIQFLFECYVGGTIPYFMSKQVTYDLFSRHSMVYSNVPGPDIPVKFGGEAVKSFYMVYPNLITQVGAITLNGKMYYCLVVDKNVVEQPEKIAAYLIQDLKELAQDCGMDVSQMLTSL